MSHFHQGHDRKRRVLFPMRRLHPLEDCYEPTLDPDFAADLEDIIKICKPREISSWE